MESDLEISQSQLLLSTKGKDDEEESSCDNTKGKSAVTDSRSQSSPMLASNDEETDDTKDKSSAKKEKCCRCDCFCCMRILCYGIIIAINMLLFLGVISCLILQYTHIIDQKIESPCKIQKLLVYKYPVLINEEGFDISSSVSVMLSYDDVTNNSCSKVFSGSCFDNRTTETNINNITLSPKQNSYTISDYSSPLYALKGTNVSCDIATNATGSGCIYFMIHKCKIHNNCNSANLRILKTYNHSTCGLLGVNTTSFTLNETAIYYITIISNSTLEIKANVTLHVIGFDTSESSRKYLTNRTLCPGVPIDIEQRHSACPQNQKLYVFVESTFIGQVEYSLNCREINDSVDRKNSDILPGALGGASILAICLQVLWFIIKNLSKNVENGQKNPK